MAGLNGWEFVILIGVLLLLFGAKKLPDMARSIGQSARVFKGEMKGLKSDDEATAPAPKDPSPSAALPVVPEESTPRPARQQNPADAS